MAIEKMKKLRLLAVRDQKKALLRKLMLLGCIEVSEPELSELPCLCLAMDCARRGGTAPAILSAANEAAVALFLQRKIGYNEIYDCVADALSRIEINQTPALEDILLADSAARKLVMERYT